MFVDQDWSDRDMNCRHKKSEYCDVMMKYMIEVWDAVQEAFVEDDEDENAEPEFESLDWR